MHQHQPLSQQDSYSEDGRVSSQNSIRSENQHFLTHTSRSSSRSTLEIGLNNFQNTQSPANPLNSNNKKPMSNAKPPVIHINGKTTEIQLSSDNCKKPTKQNKRNGLCNEPETESTQTPTNNDLLPPQYTMSSERVDEFSGLPVPNLNKKMKIDSTSNVTITSSIKSEEYSPGDGYSRQTTNKSVDSSAVIKPSEVKKRAGTNDKNIVSASSTPATSKRNMFADILVGLDDALLKTYPLKENKSKPTVRSVNINNINTDKEITLKTAAISKRNKNYKKSKQKVNKCNKCTQIYTNCIKRYIQCAENSSFCKKFKRFQYYGREYVTTSAVFRYFILLCILANCIFIALEDPTGDDHSDINQLVNKAENIFAAIFTLEMVIKMLCNGLFGNHMDDLLTDSQTQHPNEANIDQEPSQNQINQTDGQTPDNYGDEKIDPKQAIEMADFGHDININIGPNALPIVSTMAHDLKYSKTPSRSGRTASDSTSTWQSTQKSCSISTEKQQNDRYPDKYVGYFRDNWNILDFIIVVTSWIEWLPIDAGSNLTAIRVLRVLRPLRTFTKIKSLKVLIATIIKSLRGLSDVLVLLLFLCVVFAIIAIQMFNGALHQQCFSADFRDTAQSEWCCEDATKWVEDGYFCILPKGESGSNDVDNGCPVHLPWCLNIAPNPNGGVTNFDNIGYAMLNVFVTISLEGWAAIQYKLEDTGNTLAWMYFIPLTFIVGFFAANLCLAVIESVYGEEMAKKHKKEKRDGADCIDKQALDETERAWKAQKKAKMVIMQTPDTITKDMSMNPFDIQFRKSDMHLSVVEDHNVITPGNMDDFDRITPSNRNAITPSYYTQASFRLPYNLDGEESIFKTRIKMELVDKPPMPETVNVLGGGGHFRSKSVSNSPQKRRGTDVDLKRSKTDKLHRVPMSSHQAGLIQTSQEWDDIQIDKMNRENIKNKKINHHKQSSSFKLGKSVKKIQFQQGLGLGTISYMYRYRTGDLAKSETVSKVEEQHKTVSFSASPAKSKNRKLADTKHKYKHKKKSHDHAMRHMDSGFMSENDALDGEEEAEHTDLDIDTDNEMEDVNVVLPDNLNAAKSTGQLNQLTVDQRRNKFSKRFDPANRSMQSITRSRDHQRASNLLKKVDYKSTTQENFVTALQRVKTFVAPEKQQELEKDREEYDTAHTFAHLDADARGRVDDLTFGDIPTQDKEQKTSAMPDELRKRAHRAKKKRKLNEILARKAILITKKEPTWVAWVEARDAVWIKKLNAFVVSGIFESFIMFIIVANTVVLALTWPQQDEDLRDVLESVNTVFTFIFILEAVLKLIGLGPKAYFEDNWNKFDFIIVLVSIIEMVIGLASGGFSASGGSAISALRSMRLLRAFRLLGKFDSLKQLFMLVVASMHEVSVLTMVLAIFIFMFAALAMSLFGGKLIALGDRRNGRWRYDNFYWSWVNVFMVISGDSWNEVMYDTVKATNGKLSVIYYVIVVCFGTFVILNLFVAILLSKMSSEESDEDFMLDGLEKYSREMFIHDVEIDDQVDRLVMSIERKKYIAQFKDKRSKWKHHRLKRKIEGKSLGIFEPDNKFRKVCHGIVHWTWFEISIDILILINCIFLALESPAEREKNSQTFFVADIFFTVIFVLEFIIKVIALGMFQQPFRKRRSWTKIRDDDKLIEWTDRSYQAIFFMHTLNPKILDLPGLAIECIKSNDGFCIVHIWGQQVLRIVYENGSFATCYKLVDQDEGIWEIWLDVKDDDEKLDRELQTVLTSFDLTDHHHNAYFASNWNRLDAVVVLVAVLGVGFENVSFLRAMRAFRPFRIMVRFKKIKVVLGALLRAIPGLFNTFLFCILFWFVLSILGVNWFNGLYRHCEIDDFAQYATPNVTSGWLGCNNLYSNATLTATAECDYCSPACIMYNFNKTECDSYPGLIWWVSVFNFDNVFQALHALFCVATLSGWNFVMYEAIDATEFDQALIEDNRPECALYFMIVVVLCSFFSLNLIVSVVVDNFNTIKAEKDGSAFQTEEQALWVNNQRLLERISLDPTFDNPKNCFRRLSFKIVQHDFFDPFIMTCIILNAVSMGLEHYNQSEQWSIALNIADTLFVVIFVLEAILKIAAYGFRLYILSNWNKFDFVISIIGVVGLLTDSGLGLNVLRLFRVGRLLRLLHKAKTLKMLFWTLVYSIPSLWNIGLLLFVIFFIYAVVGMHILTDYETAIYDQVNANDFWNAVLLLYRVGTEDGWTDVYQSYLEAWPVGERYKIYIYFVSFFILGTLVLINLFIAVVLDSFEENHQSFSREDKFLTIQIWRDIWQYFDPDAKRELPVRDFIDILRLTPLSQDFIDKHKIKGPGFHPQNPFETMFEKVTEEHSKQEPSRLSKSFTNLGMQHEGDSHAAFTSPAAMAHLTRRLAAFYDVNQRREQMRAIATATTVSHSDMLKLLLRLRLRVELRIASHAQLTCFGKIAKLVYDICNSMGIGNRAQTDEAIRQHTLKGDKRASFLSKKETEELQRELTELDTFDVGEENTWYVLYDDALLAICSEVIGPRLPDGFPMFQISSPGEDDDGSALQLQQTQLQQTQLRIAEWYTIKNDCYDVFKRVTLDIEHNKQFTAIVPSQHVSDERQKELQKQTGKSLKYRMEFKKLTQQINDIKEEQEEEKEELDTNKNKESVDFMNNLIDEYNDMDIDNDENIDDDTTVTPQL